MLVIDGKRVSEEDLIERLKDYDKVVTIKLILPGEGRQLSNGKTLPQTPLIKIPMRFTVADPNKGGKTVSVIYSEYDEIPLNEHGVVPKDYHPKEYRITKTVAKISKSEKSELLLALALSPYNATNMLYDGRPMNASSQPLFSMPKKGAAAKATNNKDGALLKVLNYLTGEKRISDKKASDLYKHYIGTTDDLIENEDYESIRMKLSDLGKTDPEKFVSIIEDTMYDTKAKVAEAFEKGILVASDSRKVTWGPSVEGRDHKTTICQYGIGADKVDFFTEWLTRKDVTGEVRDCMLNQLDMLALAD